MRKKFGSGSANRDEGAADPDDAWNTLRICYDGPADARRGSASTGRETHDAQSWGMEAQTKRLETVTSLVLTHAGFKIYNFARCVPAWVVGVRSAGPPPPMTALRCLLTLFTLTMTRAGARIATAGVETLVRAAAGEHTAE